MRLLISLNVYCYSDATKLTQNKLCIKKIPPRWCVSFVFSADCIFSLLLSWILEKPKLPSKYFGLSKMQGRFSSFLNVCKTHFPLKFICFTCHCSVSFSLPFNSLYSFLTVWCLRCLDVIWRLHKRRSLRVQKCLEKRKKNLRKVLLGVSNLAFHCLHSRYNMPC